VAASALIPAVPGRAGVPVDLAGASLVAAGLTALLLAISKGNDWGWDSGRVLGLFAAAALLLVAFAAVERRRGHPLIDPEFLSRPPFANAMVCALAIGFAFAIAVIAVPQLAALPEITGYGLGYTVTEIGLLLAPMALASIAGAWVAGRTVDAVGPRVLMAAGALLAGAGYLALLVAHGSAAPIAAGTGVIGVGLGLTVTGILSIVGRASVAEKTSAATAVNAVVRTTGTAVGSAAAAAIITGAFVGPLPLPAESGLEDCFTMGAIASGVALLSSALLPGRPRG
jgi:MFS family permease